MREKNALGRALALIVLAVAVLGVRRLTGGACSLEHGGSCCLSAHAK